MPVGDGTQRGSEARGADKHHNNVTSEKKKAGERVDETDKAEDRKKEFERKYKQT